MIIDVKIAEKMLVIAPDIRIWSARTKMQPEDYGMERDSLPPEELATLGVKKLCPPEKLRPFAMLKSRAVSLLSRVGVPFLPGSWLIPADKAGEMSRALETIREDFNHAKDSFMAEYDATCADWISQHPGYSGMLRSSMASPDYVRSRISFAWRAFSLRISRHSNIRDELEHLGDAIFADIAKEANVVRREVFTDRDVVTQKALSPIRNLHGKLSELGFVHPYVANAAALVRSCMEQMPPKGNIEGVHLTRVQAMLALLCDPEALEDCAMRMAKGTDPVSLLPPVEETGPAMPPARLRSYIRNDAGLW